MLFINIGQTNPSPCIGFEGMNDQQIRTAATGGTSCKFAVDLHYYTITQGILFLIGKFPLHHEQHA
jgi:hypothetical protein